MKNNIKRSVRAGLPTGQYPLITPARFTKQLEAPADAASKLSKAELEARRAKLEGRLEALTPLEAEQIVAFVLKTAVPTASEQSAVQGIVGHADVKVALDRPERDWLSSRD